MVSDKTIHKAFRIHKTLKTKPIRDFLFFSPSTYMYQNDTLVDFGEANVSEVLLKVAVCDWK